MKKLIVFWVLLLSVELVVSQENKLQKVFVGTFTSEGAEGIYLCNFNAEDGTISLDKTFKAIDNPSFLKLSPDKKYLYVVSRSPQAIESEGGYVCAYKVDADGTIHLINKQVSHGQDPCHVDISHDGKYVAIASYGSGTISLYPVNNDGSLKPATSVIANEGSGPNKSRQSAPHAHSTKFSPFNNRVFNADLGTDQLNIFTLENSRLVPYTQEYAKMKPGSGPRHFDFHPNGNVIYVINELSSTVTALKKQDDQWAVFQDISALPAGFSGESYSADIHITSDGRYLYGSNRGHNSIAVFAVGTSQRLNFKGAVSCEGNWPRNFTLSPDEKFMLVANERSGDITVFKIDKETGMPVFTGNKIDLPAPVCLEFY